jgi:hypothetical protein
VRLLAIFLSTAIFLQSLVMTPPLAYAATVNFETFSSGNASSIGGINGNIPCHKLGVLLLAEGVALINGDDISVKGKTPPTAPVHELVSGKVVQQLLSQPSDNPVLKGTVFFNHGPDLTRLEPHCSEERLDLTDGTKIVGHILELNHEFCKIQPLTGSEQDVPMSRIEKIHSPRVFQFSIQLSGRPTEGKPVQVDASEIIFEATCYPTVLIGHVHHKKRLIIFVTTLLIATGISCGVAIPLGVHHHHSAPPVHLAFFPKPQPLTPIPIPHTRFTLPPRQTGEPEQPQQPQTPVTFTRHALVITTGIARKLQLPPKPPPPRNPLGPPNGP